MAIEHRYREYIYITLANHALGGFPNIPKIIGHMIKMENFPSKESNLVVVFMLRMILKNLFIKDYIKENYIHYLFCIELLKRAFCSFCCNDMQEGIFQHDNFKLRY